MGVVAVVIVVVVVACFLVSIFVRRHGESDRAHATWRRTDEIFNDPSTNRVMRVWLDESGERHYVPEPKATH